MQVRAMADDDADRIDYGPDELPEYTPWYAADDESTDSTDSTDYDPASITGEHTSTGGP